MGVFMKYLDSMKQWQRIKREYENSGLTVKKYCELNGLSKATFYRHVGALKELNLNQDIERLVNLVSIYINGNKLQFDPTIDDQTLGRIIKACAKIKK